MPLPRDFFPFHLSNPFIRQSNYPTIPSPTRQQTSYERAQAQHALRAERQRQEQAKHEITQLQAERRFVLDTFKTVTTNHKQLNKTLEDIESANERWQTPNANLEELYRLKDKIEQVEKQVKECHRLWDELGEEIEEKHVEIAFGGSGSG